MDGGGEKGETMKKMKYVRHPPKLTIFVHDIWYQMKVMHIRFHISKSVIEEVEDMG